MKQKVNIKLIFILMITIILFFYNIIFGIFLLIIIFLFLNIFKIRFLNKKDILIAIIISFLAYFFILFHTKNKILFGSWIDNIFNYSLRDEIYNYVTDNFDYKTSGLINLTILAKKDNYSKIIYQNLNSLSISYLIIISGFHISTLIKFLEKIIRIKKVYIPINLILIFLINYMLDFGYGSFRVLIYYFICLFRRMKKYSNLDKLLLTGIIILLINPLAISNYGFLLSFISCLSIIYVNDLNIKNRIIKNILASLLINVLNIIIIAKITNTLSIFYLLISQFYSWIFFINFFIYFFTFFMPFLNFLHVFLAQITLFIIDSFLSINIQIPLITFKNYYYFLYYELVLIMLVWFYCLFKRNDLNLWVNINKMPNKLFLYKYDANF